jgi:VanZ family protein
MSPQRVRALCVGLAAVSVLAIVLATLTPNLGAVVTPGRFALWSGHFLLFAALGMTIGLAYMTTRRSRLWLVQLVLLVAMFAAADELAQGLVDGRVVDLRDWVADAVGGGVGITLGSWAGRYLMPRRIA